MTFKTILYSQRTTKLRGYEKQGGYKDDACFASIDRWTADAATSAALCMASRPTSVRHSYASVDNTIHVRLCGK